MIVTEAMLDAAMSFIEKPVAAHLHSASGRPWVKALLDAALAAVAEDRVSEPPMVPKPPTVRDHCPECRGARLDDRVPDCLGWPRARFRRRRSRLDQIVEGVVLSE